MLEIEYEFREKDLIHYNELQIESSEDLQKKLKRNRLFFPGVLSIFGLFLWSYYSDYRTALYIITISICWAIVIPQIIILSFRKQIFIFNFKHCLPFKSCARCYLPCIIIVMATLLIITIWQLLLV
jgi:hypothetical protein